MNKKEENKIKNWEHLNSHELFKHSRITLIEDDVKLPNGQIISYLRFANTGNAITILCIKEEKILIQKEYSYPVNEVLYQFPGGKVEKGETSSQAAKRELMEESGYKSTKLEQIGWYYINNRRTDAKMFIVLTQNPESGHKTQGDLEEDIRSEWIPFSTLEKMILNGKIVNYSVLAAWSFFKAKKM